jgi:catechol 2,3-dioxygenase-like lactoylglutathione lyase family enzyme
LQVHHIALRVSDLERATRFYADLLGLPIRARHADENGAARSIWLRAGDAILMLERALAGVGPDSGSGHLLAFAVEDLAPWETRLREAGVALDGRTRFTLYFRDPDGHRVGLSTYRDP